MAHKPRWVPSTSPTEPLLVRAAKAAEKRRAAERNARLLIARAALGDEIGLKARIVWMLWRSGDPEQQMAARLLVRYFRTGRFAEPAKTTMGRPPQPVKCKRTPTGESTECEVPRNEIALSVFRHLAPDPEPPRSALAAIFDADERRRSLRRRKLGKAVADTARFFVISKDVARDCFEDHRDDLLLFGDTITWS